MTFDIEVTQGDRCDQQRSGRCWMFASLNTMRYRIIKKYDLKTFELSQCYPLFWDKMEKSNWFFENILDTLDEPLTGRLMAFLLDAPIGDGGQWDMFKSLVRKYGVVPKEAMPETACSRNTSDMDRYLTRYLRGAAKRLRETHEWGKTKQAIDCYEETLKNGKKDKWYFAANAALQLGLIYEKTGNRTKATECYNQCLSLNPNEYSNSIHQKAKAGLSRLK